MHTVGAAVSDGLHWANCQYADRKVALASKDRGGLKLGQHKPESRMRLGRVGNS